jgi:hypothetical protein
MNDITNLHSYKPVSIENYKGRLIKIESFMDSSWGSLLPEHPGALDLTYYVFRIDGVLNNMIHSSEQSAKETARRIVGKNTKEYVDKWLASGGCFYLGGT